MHKNFTIVFHHSEEIDPIDISGMRLRLSAEFVNVSNGVKREVEVIPA
jgi:hypothetical protein